MDCLPASPQSFTTVLFDFGGVVTTSPFDAFAAYEASSNLPSGFIRQLNTLNPDTNAWAKLERGEVSGEDFAVLFEAEAASLGQALSGFEVLGLVSGAVRPQMVQAIASLKQAGYTVACLTNNFARGTITKPSDPEVGAALEMFDEIFESSRLGVRKPELDFYRLVLDKLGVEAQRVVFLDDLGMNLKPARTMGMTTIKVLDPDDALAELSALLS